MKKFMVLSLALAVVGLANAGLDLTTIPGMSYEVDTVAKTVTISGTGVVGFIFNLAPDAGVVTGAEVSSAFGTMRDNGTDPVGEGMTTHAAGSWIMVSGVNTAPVTGVLAVVSYTGNPTELTFFHEQEFWYGDSGVDFGAGAVDLAGYTIVVPEPMTLGILGLGALFLRKRK